MKVIYNYALTANNVCSTSCMNIDKYCIQICLVTQVDYYIELSARCLYSEAQLHEACQLTFIIYVITVAPECNVIPLYFACELKKY